MEKAPEQGAFFVLCLLFGFDGCGVGAVAQTQGRRDHDQGLDAQRLPDPAAEQGDEDGDHMVDGHAGGDGGLDLLGTVSQILYLNIGRHRGQRNDGVQHIVVAAHDKGHIHGEQLVGKAVEEADNHQNQCVGHHDGLIAHLIDDLAHHRRQQEACHRADGVQQTDGGGAGTVKQNQHIGAKGEEHLLAGAVEHLQHIIFGVFFMEIEAALGLVGGGTALDAQGKHRADTGQHCCANEEGVVNALSKKIDNGEYKGF